MGIISRLFRRDQDDAQALTADQKILSDAPDEPKKLGTATVQSSAEMKNEAELNALLEKVEKRQKAASLQELCAAAEAVSKAGMADLKALAAEKDARPPVTEAELLQYDAEYFAPVLSRIIEKGGAMHQAYSHAFALAKTELLRQPKLFALATKWESGRVRELLESPKSPDTDRLVRGLVFRVGDYCVLHSAMLCADACDLAPNCIALYLLLTAERLPEAERRQRIDAGDGTDKTAFTTAMESLRVIDQAWHFTIM